MTESLSEVQLQLARELVDDVELSRLPAEQTLLKALRLTRLLEDEEAQEWLGYELSGYPLCASQRQDRGIVRLFARDPGSVPPQGRQSAKPCPQPLPARQESGRRDPYEWEAGCRWRGHVRW